MKYDNDDAHIKQTGYILKAYASACVHDFRKEKCLKTRFGCLKRSTAATHLLPCIDD